MAAHSWKEWEKPLLDLEAAIEKLKALARTVPDERKGEVERDVAEYQRRLHHGISVIYSNLTPWEKVLVSRADARPYTLDYVSALFDDFVELDGDRCFGADHAIVGGPASFEGRAVMVVGHQKGRNIQERQYRNFGMAKPEGFRKAIRLFQMADRFSLPIITFVDTPAADPGIESESRGISEAIADSMLAMFNVRTPIVSVVIGEGGSGGAIGIAASNALLMLEHSIYSVIPPEGCAAILWRQPEKGPQAAAALQLTAESAYRLGMADEIVPEPFGGAHRAPAEAAVAVKSAVARRLAELSKMSGEQLKEHRYQRFRAMGRLVEAALQ